MNTSSEEHAPTSSLHPLAPKRSSLTGEVSLSRHTFPDEPTVLALKRSWGVALSASSAPALFPPSGFRKQDDARAGCDLLMRAIAADRTNGDCLVLENLEPILTWLTCALSSKETTTGLQAILDLVKELFVYLGEQRRELSDAEALCFVPYLIEKSSSAKVSTTPLLFDALTFIRFRDDSVTNSMQPKPCSNPKGSCR